MSYIVLKKPFDPNDPLTRWEQVAFVNSNADRNKTIAASTFHRGDLFTCISLDYISDIENHAEWISVATSSKVVKLAPRDSILDEYGITWFNAYESFGFLDMMFLLPNLKRDQREIATILFLCTKDSVLQNVSQEVIGIKQKAYVERSILLAEDFLLDKSNSANLKSLQKELIYHIQQGTDNTYLYFWLLSVCGSLDRPRTSSDFFQFIQNAIESLDGFPAESHDEFLAKFRSYVPLPMLLLALAEKKPLSTVALVRPK